MQFSCACLRLGEIFFNVFVLNRGNKTVQFFDFFRYDIHRCDVVVLRKQHGKRQSDVAGSGNGDPVRTDFSRKLFCGRLQNLVNLKTKRCTQ